MTGRRKTGLTPEKWLALGAVTAIGLGVNIARQLSKSPEERVRDGEAWGKKRAARRAAERAAETARKKSISEAKAYISWISSPEGRTAYEAETHLFAAVRRPFPDAAVMQVSSGYPSRTYAAQSTAVNASFKAYFDFVSARGAWRWQSGDVHLQGEFRDGENFVLHCPPGTDHLTAEQRDTILRLLGASGGPVKVAFVRAHDARAMWDKLFAEHQARTQVRD